MKYFLPCFFLMLFFSCKEKEIPRGHFHLTHSSNNENGYITIDFANDTFWVLRESEVRNYTCWVFREHGKADCRENGLGSFDYVILDDIIIIDTERAGQFTGYRCEGKCCNIKEDLKQGNEIKVEIDLPEIKNKRKELNPIFSYADRPLTLYMYIGQPKIEHQKEYGTEHTLQLNDKIAKTHHLDSFIEEKKMTVQKNLIHKISCEIKADKHTPIPLLKSIHKELKKNNINNIRINCFKEHVKPYIHREYINVDSIDLNYEGVLSDIIN